MAIQTKDRKRMLKENPLDYNSTEYIGEFNCGGFALQTLDWYIPASWRDYEGGVESEEDLELAFNLCTEDIIKDYEVRGDTDYYLEEIPNYASVPIGVEVIGFRFDVELNDEFDDDDITNRYFLDDFHFIWRDSKGVWWDKPGFTEVKQFTQGLYDDWNGRYNSEIIWFAKRKFL